MDILQTLRVSTNHITDELLSKDWTEDFKSIDPNHDVLSHHVLGVPRNTQGLYRHAYSVTQGFFAINYPHTKFICYVCGYLSQLHGRLNEWRKGPSHPSSDRIEFNYLIQISV